MVKRLGIFAGSFDPIHDGHIEVARMSLEYLDLDKVYLLVEAQPWGNKSPVDVEYREQMVDIALEDNDDIERLSTKHDKFTVKETLKDLEEKFKDYELYFIFGADTFMKMNKNSWSDLDKLTKHYLVVFERGIFSEENISNHAKELGLAIAILPSPRPKHSSTDVRFAADKHLWLPKEVADYIESNNLYL